MFGDRKSHEYEWTVKYGWNVSRSLVMSWNRQSLNLGGLQDNNPSPIGACCLSCHPLSFFFFGLTFRFSPTLWAGTMSFAFQGFGLGEFFKAQQKLTDILDVYFWGIFDAPSAFLSLGRTLGDLSEEIDRLFDENSNPNSAILRSDNRPNIQQILRVTSHGVLDTVDELENLLRIASGDKKQDWSSPSSREDLFVALESSGLRPKVAGLNNKFAFQTWKLKLFFRISRK